MTGCLPRHSHTISHTSSQAQHYLCVTQELGHLSFSHGAQDGLPDRQLEFLANDEFHGLPPGTTVIQHWLGWAAE